MTTSCLRFGVTVSTALSFVACGSGPTSPQAIEVVPTPGLQGFPAGLDSLRVDLRIPGMAAAIVEDGEIIWGRGFGQARVDGDLAATRTTPFHLASLTKPFGATVLMQLVEEGLVDLDDPVSDYGVDLSGQGTVRVRHLLTHTSEGVPGSSYQYSGNRFANLDQVILSASGRSFADLLVERILRPLGLLDTAPNPKSKKDFDWTGLDRNEFRSRMADGYEVNGAVVQAKEHPDYFGTAAGLVASVEDVASFSIAIDEGRLLTPETWEAVFSPAISNSGGALPYGLGWFIQEYEGVSLQWHYGYWTTNSSLIVRVPERKITLVVLANTQTLSSPYGLGGDNDVMRSAVARLFVEDHILGNHPLPRGG